MYSKEEVEQNLWAPFTEDEKDMVFELDEMERNVQSSEAQFLGSIIDCLEQDSLANFSCKQRNWIHKMHEKYFE